MPNQLFIPSTEASITNSFVALLGAAPGATYMTQAKSLGAINTTQVLINFTGKTSASELTDLIVSRLGLSSVYAAKDYIFTQIINAGGVSKAGGVILETLNLFTTLTNDSTFGSYANAYVTKLNTALAYSLVTSNNSTDLTTLARVVSSSSSSSNTVTSSSSSETVTFTMSPTATSMNEGAHNLIVVSSSNADPGSTLAYTITGIDASRLSSGSLSGVLTLDSYGQAVIDLGVVANLQTDGASTVTVSLVNGKASARISVLDSSRTPETISPSYTLSAASSSLNEGSRNLITLTTANIAAGSQFSYSISGIDPARLSTGSLAGTFTTDANGRAILDLGVLSNNQTDGSTTVRLSLANGLAATAFTVNDTSTSSSNSNSNSNSNSDSSSETLALTTDSETIEVSDSEIVTGTLTTSGTYSDGDVISGEAESILRLTASGSNTAIAEVNGVGQVQIILSANSSLDLGLWSDVGLLSLTGGASQKTFTLLNADLNTTYGIASSRQQTLLIEYNESGSNNTALLKLAGSGLPTTNNTEHRAVIDISANNSIENISLTTSGTNYAEIIANTDVDTFTISGNGTNHLLITDPAEAHLDIDMSTSSGRNTVDIGSSLNNTTSITGGFGIDELIANIEINTTADFDLAPTVSDIEILNLTVNSPVTDSDLSLDAMFIDDIETIHLDTIRDTYIYNLPTTFETLRITNAASNGDADFGIYYDDNENGLGDLTVELGAANQQEIEIGELGIDNINRLSINAYEDTDVQVYDLYIENETIQQFEVNNIGTGTLRVNRPDFGLYMVDDYVTIDLESIAFSSTNGGIIEAGNFWAGNIEEGGTLLPRGDYLTPELSTVTLEADNGGALYIGDISAYYVGEGEAAGYEFSSLRTIDLHADNDSSIYMGRIYAGGADYYSDDGNHWGVVVDDINTSIYVEAETDGLVDWGNSSWNDDAYIGGYIDNLSLIAHSNASIEVGAIQVIGNPANSGETYGGEIETITISAEADSYIYLDSITAENYLGDMTITQAQDAEIENDQFVAGDNPNDYLYDNYGSIGNITFTAENNAGWADLNFYAYDNTSWVDYSNNTEIGDLNITLGSNSEDHYFYFESDGSIGDVSVNISDSYAELILNARKSVGSITLSGDGHIHLELSQEDYYYDYGTWSYVPWTSLASADEIDASNTTDGADIYAYVVNGARVITGQGDDSIEFGDNDASDIVLYKENNSVGHTTGSLINGTRDEILGFETDYDSIQFGISDTSFIESLIGVTGSDEYINGGSEVIYLESMIDDSTFTHGVQGAIEFYDNGTDVIVAINTNHNSVLDDNDIVITLTGIGYNAGETSWGFTLNETGNLYIT